MTDVVQMPPQLEEKVHNAIRNEHHASFWVGDPNKGGREFPIKDLGYDDYMEFLNLSKPIIAAVVQLVSLNAKDGEISFEPDMSALSVDKIVELAGENLPRLAWLCCRQSDPDITVDEVKRLARRPWALVTPIVAQVKHNELAREIMDFFLNAPALVTEMIPDLGHIVGPDQTSQTKIPVSASKTKATR